MISIALRPARLYLLLIITLFALACFLFNSVPPSDTIDVGRPASRMTTPPITSTWPVPEDCSDHLFATKHSVPLYLRLYPAPPSSPLPIPGKARPWLLWIHGGAYISGQHWQLRNWILPLFHARGYHVVANAYRYMPFVEMEDMMEDCQDALTWCRNHLAGILGDRGVELDTWVLGGDSAGGGLATLLVHRLPLEQRPKAVINLYGVTDMIVQQQKYDEEPKPTEPWSGEVSEEALQRFYTDTDPSHAVTVTINNWNLAFLGQDIINKGQKAIYENLKKIWRVSDEEWKFDERVERQWDVKNYHNYNKAMVTMSLRLDGMSKAAAEEKMKRYSSVYLLDGQKTYPPTVQLHGTGDNAVPVQESIDMAKTLRAMGVDSLELYPKGMDHGWDNVYMASLLYGGEH